MRSWPTITEFNETPPIRVSAGFLALRVIAPLIGWPCSRLEPTGKPRRQPSESLIAAKRLMLPRHWQGGW